MLSPRPAADVIDMQDILWIDFESLSKCDLGGRGVYNYMRDPSTQVLCMSWAVNDNEVQTWVPGAPFPAEVKTFRGQIRAHNAAFERLLFWYILCPDYDIPEPALEQFYCTAAQARANCAPGSLEDVGRFSGASMRKDHRGAQLVRALCMPRVDGTFREDKQLFAELIEYCEQDVRAMRAVSKGMRELSDDELAEYHTNERINDRGVRVDTDLCVAAINYASAEVEDIQAIVREVTAGEITSVRSPKMRQWVFDRVGDQARELMATYKDGEKKYSIDKNARASLLSLADEDPEQVPPDVAEVIQCADDLWASSVAKFARLRSLADDDDARVRGAFVFAGGSATGRASSYGAQVHNFARKTAKDPDAARQAMVRGHKIVPEFGKRVTDVLKGMLRPSLLAAEGKHLVVADWSAIEGRVNPWLTASEHGDDKLDVFRSGLDPYKVNAAATFHTAYEAVTGEERQVGKVQELACVAGCTLVLTNSGWMAITDITEQHKLWDGESWVTHAGLVRRGVKQTINVCGMYATEDHLFLAQHDWVAAKTVRSISSFQTRALATGSENLPWSTALWRNTARQRYGVWPFNAPAVRLHTLCNYTIFLKALLRAATRALKRHPATGARTTLDMQKRVQTTRTDAGCSTGYLRARTAATTQRIAGILTTAGAASASTSLGCRIKQRFFATFLRWMGGINRVSTWTVLTLTRAMSRATCGLSHASRTATTNDRCVTLNSELPSWRLVYDIANAGPNSRFTVLTDRGPMIVHNCGFGGSVGAFAAMGRIYGLQLPEPEARRMVDGWRRANPWALPFWSSLEDAARRAMRNRGHEFKAGRIVYLFDGAHLWYALPSGRILCYPFARFDDEGNITYAKASWKPAADAKEWPRARLWRGLQCENVTQATANDILRHALRQLEALGEDVVLHVHDEIVCETDDPERTLANMQRVMCTPPNWAGGLPLGVEAHIMRRYGKG